MPAKKPKRPKQPDMDTMNSTTPGGSDSDDLITISIPSDTTIDLGDLTSSYTVGNIDTITLDPSYISTNISSNWSTSDYGLYSINHSSNVNITGDGITMKPESDLKIGDRSLKDFMDRVEDRLAILHPNEALEDKWEELKNLRRQYEALEKDILEKEKIMKILKEQ
jgi:hypothetical protein